VVEYVKRWTERTELPKTRLITWLGVGMSKFYQWQDRYGQANEHNGQIPRDFWLQEWERRAILDFHDRHPLEGYRRLAVLMLDDDVAAVRPSTVYRTLKTAGRLDHRQFSPSKKGTGFVQPLTAHQHWHMDISYLNVAGTFYFLISLLDGFSRYIVHWEIREKMEESAMSRRSCSGPWRSIQAPSRGSSATTARSSSPETSRSSSASWV
jgi:transposase InsO family protein